MTFTITVNKRVHHKKLLYLTCVIMKNDGVGKFKLAGDAVCVHNYDCLETTGLNEGVIQGCYLVRRAGRLGNINHSWIVYFFDRSNKSSMEKK